MDLSHYPKTREESKAYRAAVIAWCQNSPKRQAEVRQRCKDDLLFFINVFGYLAEQRRDAATGLVKLPFLTFEYQDNALLRMAASLGRKHVVGDKSRDVGFTWMVLYLFVWRWLFYQLESFGVASRTEEYVDKPGSPDSHFWKIDFILKNLPSFLLPRKWKRRKKQLVNYDLQSDITGYATSKDIARGGRRLAILLDELAAYHYADGKGCWAAATFATNSVFAVSTHQGTVGAFADACRTAAEHGRLFEHIVIRWWEDPRKNQGLCIVSAKDPQAGMSEWTLQNREGGRWTQWFEDMCAILFYDEKMIAQELEGDPSAAGYAFFSPPLLTRARSLGCRSPLRVGRLIYDHDTREPLTWVDDSKGNIKLWCELVGERPPIGAYAAGCDVSAGTGKSPSVIALGSKTLGVKMAEFVDGRRSPSQFAADMVAFSRWFHNATLIWECKGPGGSRIGQLILKDWSYHHVWFRRDNEGGLIEKVTANVGWNPDRESKKLLLEVFRDSLGSGEYLERSEEVFKEAGNYHHTKDGGVETSKSKTDDPTNAGTNHGDRVMATALMWKVIKEGRQLSTDRSNDAAKGGPAPEHSFAWWMQKELEAKRNAELYGGLQLG